MKRTAARAGVRELAEVQELLGLTQPEIADLFGVRQATLTHWRVASFPASRLATVERLHALALVLRHQIRPSRVPKVLRTGDVWLGGRSILQVIRSEGVGPIYGYLERLFAYSMNEADRPEPNLCYMQESDE